MADIVDIKEEKSAFGGSAEGGKENDPREAETKRVYPVREPSSLTGLKSAAFSNGVNLELEEIKDGWNNVLRVSKKYNHSISAFLKLSAPVELKGDLLIIATPYKFHAEKLGEAVNRDTIAKVIAEVFVKAKGIKIKIIQDEKMSVRPAVEAAISSEKKSASIGSAEGGKNKNANFTAALDVFGGEEE